MSKRGAVGPQGGKDSNLFEFNMASTPEEKPQRATAAQMANRRIKDIRRRARPSTTAPGATGASFSPFNSIDPNTVSGSQPASNGLTFGQSQSFPGGSADPSQPSQNGGSPFAFGSGGSGAGSSSFSFSTSFAGPGLSPNPFASLNPGTPSQPSDTTTFSGFKGNMFNLPPSGSPTSGQQALPTGGLFGTPSQQNNVTGSVFGNTTTTAPSSQPITAPATTGSIFGQMGSTSATTPSTSIFGQSTMDKPSPFGQSTAFGSDSMQTSPDQKDNAVASKPSIFGSGSLSRSAFGASTGFASPAGGSVFGGATPSKPLFGAKPAEQTTPTPTPLFGAASQPAVAASTPAPIGATTTTTASSSLFGTAPLAKPATPFQSPFQSSTPFSDAPTPSATPKAAEQKEQEAALPKSGFQFSSSTTTGGNLFSKSESAAPPPSAASSTGLFQAPSTGSLFAPKLATAEADISKAPPARPFNGLFAPKSDTAKQPPQEQKPLPAPAPFGGLFAPKSSTPSEGANAGEPEKPTTFAPPFSTPAPSSPKLFAPKPSVSTAPPAPMESTTQVPAAIPTEPQVAQITGPVKLTGLANVPLGPPPEVRCAEAFRPVNLPSSLTEQQKKKADLLIRLRVLNECFQREIAELDPKTDDFDLHVLFYMRVRRAIGAPTGCRMRKRKAADADSADVETPQAKKVKPSDTSAAPVAPSTDGLSSAPKMNIAPSSITSTPSKLFDTKGSLTTNGISAEGNRPNGDSTTASIFAQSFTKSKTDDLDHGAGSAESARPSTPEATKPAFFSTTPTASPAKPLFPTPTATQETTTSSSLLSQSASKPVFTPPTTNVSAPAKNPFVLKPTGGNGAESSTSAAPAIPKFGTGTTTNFFAQFKSMADKNAEKEKLKRKAEDFDSEEEDEAEWERKDAEQQRKKRQELDSQPRKRAKFVPGKGFVFEDEGGDVAEPKKLTEPESAAPGASVFNQKPDTSAKSNNIFGHLSATPSEVEEDNDADDTEEASAAGEEPGEASKELSLVPPSEDEESRDAETSEAGSKAVSVSGAEFSANDSSEDGDLSRALKKSKQAPSAAVTGGRSLFDRVQYDEEGKPKRQTEEEPKKPFSSLFNPSSKLSSSFTAGTSTPFGSTSTHVPGQAATGSKPASSVFGSSMNTSGGLFTPAPASAGSSTSSIFGQSTSKLVGDKTWKPESSIKFASSATAAPSTLSKTESATPPTDAPKPFSTLFGAPGGTKPSGSGQQPSGFSFGGPAQQTSSFLAPSTRTSADTSRASTPGAASDTPEESGDGDATESLPQVDLARSRAGEEDEDVVLETRARALKLKPGEGWDSQGVGYLRILKNRNTSRARILLRADPSGKIVLNAALQKDIKYTASANSVQFLVPKAEGAPEQWAVRVKKEEIQRLHSAIQESKA